MHGKIQFYFDKLYNFYEKDIRKSYFAIDNEIYGELNYYSVLKLLQYLQLSKNDHFLDIGSGLGKIIFQVFLETDIKQITGIEINPLRYEISCKIKKKIEQQLSDLFKAGRILELIPGDILEKDINNVSVIYMASTVFSYDFIYALGKKINNCLSVQKVASLRKIPQLKAFEYRQRLFLHGNWGVAPCYIYTRK